MDDTITQRPPVADGTDSVLAAVETGLKILEEEREVFLAGRYEKIEKLTERKRSIITELDAAIPRTPRSDIVIEAISLLIEQSRRNEQIIVAARQGLSYARRRIASIHATERGDVAYAEDGTKIRNAEEGTNRSKSA
jgi:hypothetical protein